METFSALLAIYAGNSPVPGEFPTQRPVTRSFDVFFDLRLNNRWVNNCEAGDLRRYRALYDVIVIFCEISSVILYDGALSSKRLSNQWWPIIPQKSLATTENSYESHGVSNQRPLDCFKSLFRLISKKTSTYYSAQRVSIALTFLPNRAKVYSTVLTTDDLATFYQNEFCVSLCAEDRDRLLW